LLAAILAEWFLFFPATPVKRLVLPLFCWAFPTFSPTVLSIPLLFVRPAFSGVAGGFCPSRHEPYICFRETRPRPVSTPVEKTIVSHPFPFFLPSPRTFFQYSQTRLSPFSFTIYTLWCFRRRTLCVFFFFFSVAAFEGFSDNALWSDFFCVEVLALLLYFANVPVPSLALSIRVIFSSALSQTYVFF